jgi:hypothetical protein
VIAAIAAAYLHVSRRDAPAPPPDAVPRWRLAGRVEHADPETLRAIAGARSRWSAAGRVDG